MNARFRAALITGMAFPLGALLGVAIGNATRPDSTGGGFGDIVYVLFWFVLGAPLFSALTYTLATRRITFESGTRGRAALTVAQGIVLATIVQFAFLFALSRGVGSGWLIVGLPLMAWLVTVYVRRALQV